MTRALFVGGTASHVGKSWFVTAICRYLYGRGIRVAPFKAQNMSNNSGPCRVSGNGRGGSYGEIGRAQIAQAEACGLEPETDMNPILLKPHSERGSQVVLHGRVWRDLDASAYYDQFDILLNNVMDAYQRLASRFDFIVVEGAGSVAEINLNSRDLVNFGLARRIAAPALLLADIDRGGVFGSLHGTMALLPDADRDAVRSFAVNRFRGDPALFRDGVTFLEQKLQRRCLGVFPFAPDIPLDDEDAVTLESSRAASGATTAIVRLPHISNFTDFDRVADVSWISAPNRTLYDTVILPGTKNTAGDLFWMKERGLDRWLTRQHAAGAVLIGVCGGYQMLGETLDSEPALGFLPVHTVTRADKIVRPVRATMAGAAFDAYEIHMGVTETPPGAEAFADVDGQPEGIRLGRCFGTYLHDAFRCEAVLQTFGLRALEVVPPYDQLAHWFSANADLQLFEELYL